MFGEVTGLLCDLIRLRRMDEAVLLALQHRTEWVEQELDYDSLDDLGELASAFLQQWLQSLPPLERLQAADWAASHYVLSLVHLEHARRTGAQLYLEAQAAATAALAQSMRQVEGFSDDRTPRCTRRLLGGSTATPTSSTPCPFDFVPLDAS